MGMATRHIPGLSQPVLPSDLQPVVGNCFFSGRSPSRASCPGCCYINRCLCHGLGSHVQQVCSCEALDWAPTAVAHKLPRVASSMACFAPLQNAATRHACTGPYGQHCDHCVHQPPRRSTLPSHVATCLPSKRRRFGDAQVDLFASSDTSHCQLLYSLSEGTWRTGTQLASGLTKICVSPNKPSHTDPVQGQGG